MTNARYASSSWTKSTATRPNRQIAGSRSALTRAPDGPAPSRCAGRVVAAGAYRPSPTTRRTRAHRLPPPTNGTRHDHPSHAVTTMCERTRAGHRRAEEARRPDRALEVIAREIDERDLARVHHRGRGDAEHERRAHEHPEAVSEGKSEKARGEAERAARRDQPAAAVVGERREHAADDRARRGRDEYGRRLAVREPEIRAPRLEGALTQEAERLVGQPHDEQRGDEPEWCPHRDRCDTGEVPTSIVRDARHTKRG